MTDEQIFEIASNYLRYFADGSRGTEYSGTPEHLLEFARAIRKDTIEEILTLLKEVPNPEAHRSAINRIEAQK